jgi:hypothetical protein
MAAKAAIKGLLPPLLHASGKLSIQLTAFSVAFLAWMVTEEETGSPETNLELNPSSCIGFGDDEWLSGDFSSSMPEDPSSWEFES